jgi:hypothetical protein
MGEINTPDKFNDGEVTVCTYVYAQNTKYVLSMCIIHNNVYTVFSNKQRPLLGNFRWIIVDAAHAQIAKTRPEVA